MYATKDKSKDESTRLDAKDETSAYTQDGKKHYIILNFLTSPLIIPHMMSDLS